MNDPATAVTDEPFRQRRTGIAPRQWRATLLALLACLAALAAEPSFAASPPTPTAFTNVNVLPMDSQRVLREQTVVVERGRVVAIGPTPAIPSGARVVDGEGRAFLSPGLADMHTHSDSRADMKLYLANGVTSVLHLGEAPNAFMAQVRPAINRGETPGPHVYAAFSVDGSPRYGHLTVTTADEARWIVRLAKTNGYEFIKVYNNLSPECFEALVDEGSRLGLAVIGHGVTRVGLERQLDAGQLLVAHAEEFLYTVFTPPGETPSDRAPDPAAIPAAIRMVQRNRAFVTADLGTYATIKRQWGKPEVVEDFLRAPWIRQLAPDQRIAWQRGDYSSRKGDLSGKLEFLQRFVKAMADAGVPLVAGTDAPTIPGIAPGYSLHEDLYELQQAGLTRYQALSTATRVPGELIRRAMPAAEPFGTIEPGRRADLVLTAGNPLEDLSTLRKPLGVMASGNWYDARELQGLLDEVVREHARADVVP